MQLEQRNNISAIIDRSLPEIYPSYSKMSRLDILDFCWLLKSVGVEAVEIDSALLRKITRLPEGLDFIFRVRSEGDLEACIENGIKRCILRKPILSLPGIAQRISDWKLGVTLEVNANSLDGICSLENLIRLEEIKAVSCLRIAGLGRITSKRWVAAVEHIKSLLNVKIDICPGNRFSMGTATAFEAFEAGMDYVTAAFAGYGRDRRYVPLEELLASIKVLLHKNTKMDLSVLPELSSRFRKYTHRDIPGGKAIIGNDIFKYESGIHAGGIDKNPDTYEPFDPSVVGQKRELFIGKHSGRLSVRKKLMELGYDTDDCDLANLLVLIREKSIKAGRNLNDEELAGLYCDNVGHMAHM